MLHAVPCGCTFLLTDFLCAPRVQVVAAGPRDMRMYYNSFDRSRQRFVVGLATSPDGFKWTKKGPIFEVGWVGGCVGGWVDRAVGRQTYGRQAARHRWAAPSQVRACLPSHFAEHCAGRDSMHSGGWPPPLSPLNGNGTVCMSECGAGRAFAVLACYIAMALLLLFSTATRLETS
jgi:hypothetical protein